MSALSPTPSDKAQSQKNASTLQFIKHPHHARSPKQNRRFSGKANPPGVAVTNICHLVTARFNGWEIKRPLAHLSSFRNITSQKKMRMLRKDDR